MRVAAHFRKAFSRHYGKQDAPVLVWKAPSKTMKPSLPQSVIDDAYEQDPTCASAEFGAEFRSDVETYISREVVEAAVVNGRLGTAGRAVPLTWRSPTAMPVVSHPRCGPRASAAIFARRGSGGVRHSSKD